MHACGDLMLVYIWHISLIGTNDICVRGCATAAAGVFTAAVFLLSDGPRRVKYQVKSQEPFNHT